MAGGKFRLVETHTGVASWPAAVSGLRMEQTIRVKRKTEQNWMTCYESMLNHTFLIGPKAVWPTFHHKVVWPFSSVQFKMVSRNKELFPEANLHCRHLVSVLSILAHEDHTITDTTNSHYWQNSYYWHSSHYWHNKQPLLTKQPLLIQQPLLTQQTPVIDATNSHYWHNKQPLLTQQTMIT